MDNIVQENKRVLFVDYFKALLMILVIMGHINFANSGIKAWIYSFHMPAFFFISGMMLNYSTSYSLPLGERIRKYADRLVVPFFLWALVYAKFSYPNLLRILYGSYRSIAQAGALTSLWFLPVMFFAVLMMNQLETGFNKRIVRIEIMSLIISFAIGFLLPYSRIGYPWSINVAFIALGFMLSGRLLRTMCFEFRRFCSEIGSPRWHICVGLALLCLLSTFLYQYNLTDKGAHL